MNKIHATISSATRRLILIDSIRTITICLAAVIAFMVFARAVQKVAPVFVVPWDIVFVAAPVAAILIGLLWAYIKKPSQAQAAMIIDEKAGLRESISTALIIESQDDGWSKAVVTDATDKAATVNLKSALPITAPKLWPTPIAAGLALLAVWWLPVKDLTGLYAKQQEKQAELIQTQEVEATVAESQEALKKILEKTNLEFEDIDGESFEDLLKPEANEYISPEESLRSAIKNLTSVADKLEEKRNNEDGATFDAIKDAMKSLNTTEESPASEMARAMARGDFKEAKEQLEQLAQQMQSGDMSEENKKKAAEQLESMKKQMEQMANNSQQLEEQLKAAGLSEQQAKQLASDPDALKKALEEAGATPEQMESLAKAAQAQQKASDAAGAMSQAMGQMAQGMQSDSQQQMAQGSDAMGGQLSDLENMQQEAQSLESAMNQAQQQLDSLSQCSNPGGQGGGQQGQYPSTGQYSQGSSKNQGAGSGGGGQGLGASPQEQGADYTINKEHADVRTTAEGPVIASTMVQGSQIKGESTAVFSQAVTSAKTHASEAIETKRIPREYESAVQSYFGRLDKAAKEAEPTEKPTPKPTESKDD